MNKYNNEWKNKQATFFHLDLPRFNLPSPLEKLVTSESIL